MTEEQNETTEAAESNEVEYEILKDASIERFFNFELQLDDEGYFYNEDEDLLGAVVQFENFPTQETLVSIYDDVLTQAVMTTQEVDEVEAAEMIEDCDDPSEYSAELDVAEDFSVFFLVANYRGIYRLRMINGDLHISHSSGRKHDRWDV